MKKMFSKVVVAVALMATVVSAANEEATVQFIQGLTSMAMEGGKPTDLTSLENLWNSSIGFESEAKVLLLEATGLKEQAQTLLASIAELSGKEKLKKKERKVLEGKNAELDAMLADAAKQSDIKTPIVLRALGNISMALINNTLIVAGGKGVVENIKAGGMSPDVMSQAKAATAIVSAAPDKAAGIKALTISILGIMQTHSISIPSPEKATAGVER